MPNEIYHRSEWGNPKPEGWGDIYFDPAATNKLYNHSDYYENSDGTDKILRDIPNKASITLTPTAYSDGSINTVIPPYGLGSELITNGDFSDGLSNWTYSNVSLVDGGVNLNNVGLSGQNTYIKQTDGYVIGNTYKLELDVINTNGADLVLENANNTSIGTQTIGHKIVYFTQVNTNGITIKRLTGDTNVVIDNISVKEVQEADFDFSRGSSATRVNEKGLIEDVASGIPRIDYTTGFGSWLLEPQRTNYITYSEDFSQWTSENATATINNETSPDGTVNATKLTPTTSIQRQAIKLAQTQIGDVVISCFAKKGEYDVIQITDAMNGTYFVNFDLTNGAVGSSNTIAGEIEDYGNGWYRCIGKYNSTSSITSVRISITENSTDGRLVLFAGNGTDSLYIYGAQIEQGSYATSYIPTSGSAVTRAAETANNSGNADLFNDSEGVLYAEIAALADDQTFRQMSINGGTTNTIRIIYGTTSNQIRGFLQVGGSTKADLSYISSDITKNTKIAFKYKENDFALWVDGFEQDTDDNGITFSSGTLNSFDFNDNGAGGSPFYGKTKELAVFKEALTDAELESLTSRISFTEMATDLEYTVEWAYTTRHL